MALTAQQISHRPRTRRISYNQEQVCLLEAFYPGNRAYNFQATVHVKGGLDLACLEESVSHVVRRHEVLRTSIALGHDGYLAQVHEPFSFKIPTHDLSNLAEADRRQAFQALMHECLSHSFDVGTLPLLRITAVRLASDEWKLIQLEHHLVHDGWSLGRFWSEVQDAYNALSSGLPPRLPAVAAQYQQFVSWQRERLDGAYGAEAVDFWCAYLAGADPEIPLGKAKTATPGLDGYSFETELSAQTFHRVRQVARRVAVSDFVLMFAAFAKFLAVKSGATEFTVGTAVSARTEPDLEPMIGMAVNTIPVRVSISDGDALDRVAREVQLSFFKALKYHDVPLSLIVRRLNHTQIPGRNPVFQHCLSFHDSDVPRLRLGDAVGDIREEQNHTAKFDINAVVIPPSSSRGVSQARVLWQFSSNLFDRQEAHAHADDFQSLLTEMLDK